MPSPELPILSPPPRFLPLDELKIIEEKIRDLAKIQQTKLAVKLAQRTEEMQSDDLSHELIYECLGVYQAEGRMIDLYQNKGRLLYRSAGALLESATKLCFKHAFPESGSMKIPNTHGTRPKNFGIDCLVGGDALEIKWRDGTTDGDHVIKEHTRAMTVAEHGYKPIRVMFYAPNREQSLKIQRTLATLYHGLNGEYYAGAEAWEYVNDRTGVDLFGIMTRIARGNVASK